MKELFAYYNVKNLVRGFWIAVLMTVGAIAFGANSFWGLVLFFVFVMLSTPAVMARNDDIRKWNDIHFLDRK